MLRWRWSVNSLYSASLAYRALFIRASQLPGAKEIWKVSAPAKVKHFFWLALHKCCWTVPRHRHGLQETLTSILYGVGTEDIDHTLLFYHFSRQVWSIALAILGQTKLVPMTGTCFWSWWLMAGQRIEKERRWGFDSMTLLIGWQLWKERNSRKFNNQATMLDQVFHMIVNEGNLWVKGFKWLEGGE